MVFFDKMSGVLDERGMVILSAMLWFLDSPTILAIMGRKLLKDGFRKFGAVVMNDSVAQRA